MLLKIFQKNKEIVIREQDKGEGAVISYSQGAYKNTWFV